MDQPDYTVRVTNISQQNSFDASGKVVSTIVVQFMVGTHGPFTQRFDAHNFDQAAANAELQQFATKIRALGYS